MKKGSLVLGGSLLALVLSPTSPVRAACGIGSKIWQGNNSAPARLAAFTTNVFTWKAISTTFEIAGCTASDNLFRRLASAEVRHYASNNFDHLAEDAARGEGEHLEAFAHVLRLDPADQSEFKILAQEKFDLLFPHDSVTVDEFLAELGRQLAADEALSRYVRR